MKTKHSLFLITLAILASLGGYSLGASRSSVQPSSSVPTQEAVKGSSFFQNQTATVQGRVSAVTNNSITITKDGQQFEDFPIAQKFVVYKPVKPDAKEAIASSDVNLVEKEIDVLIMLELIDGRYQVVSISNLPKTTASQTN